MAMVSDHPFLHQAKRDLERAEVSKSKAESLLRAAEFEINRLKNFIEQYEIYAAESDKQNNISKFKAKSRTIADVAVSIIESSENPLHIQQILDGLSKYGVEVGGENKAANLAAYLSKDNRVRFERGYGWMISGERLFLDEFSPSRSSSISGAESSNTASTLVRALNHPGQTDPVNKRGRQAAHFNADDDIPF